MKAIFKQVIAAAIALVGPAAYAQEIILPFPWTDLHQVMAELDPARKDGSIKAVSVNYDFVGRTAATKTREQVAAEPAQARASGEYEALNSETCASEHGSMRTPSCGKAGSRDAQ